jgi:hypothetical protein
MEELEYTGMKTQRDGSSTVTHGQPNFDMDGEIRDISEIKPGMVVRQYYGRHDDFSSSMMVQDHPREVEGPSGDNSSWVVEVEYLEGPMEGRTQEEYLSDMGVVSYRRDDEGLVFNAQNALVMDEEATPDFVI